MKVSPRLVFLGTLIFLAVTILTQVGGLLLYGGAIAGWIAAHRKKKFYRSGMISGAILSYLLGLAVVPLIAKPLGREPLPWRATEAFPIRRRHTGYCLLFRNYVSPALADTLRKSSLKFADIYPHEKLDYLDGCFPFLDGFPLLPHLSHKDGKKIDLCFGYSNDGFAERSPSPIGYWVYEGPGTGEPQPCKKSWLRWDFDFLQNMNRTRQFDPERTRHLIRILAENQRVQRMFIEPHLKKRLNLQDKVGFQGRRAARHDDHVHVQIR